MRITPPANRKFKATRQFVLWIGGFWSGKNPLQVIEIAKELPGLDFVVLGPSRDSNLLERFNKEKPSNVHYLGAVVGAQKDLLIRECSAGLITSLKETFGWVPFEFLSEGKPVLCHPLAAFKELYGDLPIYADTTADFVRHLRRLREHRFRIDLERQAILDFQEKYSIEKAAAKIVKKTSGRPMAIFTSDKDPASDYVSGMFLVDWQLWRSLCDRGIELWIISNGSKYASRFGLLERTRLISTTMLLISQKIERLRAKKETGFVITRKLLRLLVFTLEPLSYVFSFMKYASSSEVILSEGRAQAAAAVAAKLLFRKRVMCLFHDGSLFTDQWDMSRPFTVRVFSTLLSRFIVRYADRMVTVSETLRGQILRFHASPRKVILLWS